ncbi:glutathione S-transferase family protein [Reyranella sp. CPCC 100927]|uniref:glutathione S-transferase family protein n=1 Tax=Reyranella sp. CPCC 100927 TaxID=2599616 RepID=UPI0011B7C807|nr:glutathione S-transferase family protein [Reyranella sp. CPCC 100927]TWT10536.1 glutathione S-transferase family protein [Reyranella sp. CPCC 100927]
MLRIHGYAQSINVRKVLWTCAELALPYEREDWAGPFRSTADPTFRSLNPVGMVPVIDDDGTILWESNTIVRYLTASRNRHDLLPDDPAPRARIEMWMDWQASDFNNSWRVAFQGLVRHNPDHQDAGAIERSMVTFAGMVGIVDEQLAISGGYICGSQFSAADIAIGLSVHRWRSIPVPKPRFDHVDRYYERLCERAGFRQHGRDGGP